MKYQVTEWYIDCMDPSGENDEVVRTRVVEAIDEVEARELYEQQYGIGMNNVLRARVAG